MLAGLSRVGEGALLQGGRGLVTRLAVTGLSVSEADAVSTKLTDLGGTTESHAVSDDDLEEANQAATATTS